MGTSNEELDKTDMCYQHVHIDIFMVVSEQVTDRQ